MAERAPRLREPWYEVAVRFRAYDGAHAGLIREKINRILNGDDYSPTRTFKVTGAHAVPGWMAGMLTRQEREVDDE